MVNVASSGGASTPLGVGRRLALPVAAIVIWGVHLLASYLVVSLLCRDGVDEREVLGLPVGDVVVVGMTIAMVIPVIAVTWRRWRRSRDAREHGGVAVGVYLAWALTLEGITVVFLGPCS